MFDELENTQENHEVEAEQPSQQQQTNDKENNLRILREKAQRMERERDEAINYIKNLEAKNAPKQQEADNSYDEFDLEPDSLAEGKHIRKVSNKIKDLEKQLQAYQQQSQESMVEARLKSKYSDFDEIVSGSNVESLRQMHPEVWNTINSTSDLYNKAVSAYTLIKNLGISGPAPYDVDKTSLQKNFNKPRNSSSVSPQLGDTPVTRANAFEGGLTEELKNQLYKEMQASIRNKQY